MSSSDVDRSGYKVLKPTQAKCPKCGKQALCECCGVCSSCGYEQPFCPVCGHPQVWGPHKDCVS